MSSKKDIPFTGERVVPGRSPSWLTLEHLLRYRFASYFTPGCRVLDLGCGTGYGAFLLADKARLVVGADNSEEAVQYAREHYRRPNLRFEAADCRSLPFEANAFDVVTLFEVIEHLPEQEACLNEVKRVLKSSGLLLLSTPNPDRSTKQVEEENPFHFKELRQGELLELLGRHFAHVHLFYQCEFSASAIHPAASDEMGMNYKVEQSMARGDPKYFVLVCSQQSDSVSVPTVLGVDGIERQIMTIRELRESQREIDALLGQREANQREYAENLRAHGRELEARQREIEALLRQRAAHAARIAELERHVAKLEPQVQELTWLYRWIPVNRLARRYLYGKNLRRRILSFFSHHKLN